MSLKKKTPRPLRTIKGVQDVFPELQNSPNHQEGQDKKCTSPDTRFRQQLEKADAARVKIFQAICEGDLSHPAVRFCCEVAVSDGVPKLPESEEHMAIAAVGLIINCSLLENLDEPEAVASYDESLQNAGVTSAISRRDMIDCIAKNRRLLMCHTRRAAAELFRNLGWGELPPEGYARKLMQALKYGRCGTC